MKAYTTLVRHSHYAEHIRPGRYALDPHTSTFNTFRHIKNGIQEPLKLTIPSVRTMERLAAVIGKKLLADSAEISNAIMLRKPIIPLRLDMTPYRKCFQYDLVNTLYVDATKGLEERKADILRYIRSYGIKTNTNR